MPRDRVGQLTDGDGLLTAETEQTVLLRLLQGQVRWRREGMERVFWCSCTDPHTASGRESVEQFETDLERQLLARKCVTRASNRVGNRGGFRP